MAKVTGDNRLRMQWRGQIIVDISRDFLNTNGVRQSTQVLVKAPDTESYFGKQQAWEKNSNDLKCQWLENLKDLNVCSQKGLVERFDSTIGAGTILMPFGGIYQEIRRKDWQ